MTTNDRCFRSCLALLPLTGILCATPAAAQDNAAELARKLANPVAALVSVPIQLNYDRDIGPLRDGDRWQLNLQPVIPMSLNGNWNLISRTIVPIVAQDDVFPGAGGQSGIGDITQSFFFSPKAPTSGGWIWGVGPVIVVPTFSDVSGRKWSAGPTAVVLRQQGHWTYGMLANQVWSFAGDDDRADVNATFVQPFLTYATPTAWSFTLQTESSYNWNADQWTVPVNVMVSKVTRVGSQLVSVGGGVRYWAEGPDAAPHDWGFRFVVTLLYPK